MLNNLRNFLWLLKPDVTVHISTREGDGWLDVGKVNTLSEEFPAYLLERRVEETRLEPYIGLVIVIEGKEDGEF